MPEFILPWGEWFSAVWYCFANNPDAIRTTIVGVWFVGIAIGGGIGAALDKTEDGDGMFCGAFIGTLWPMMIPVLVIFAVGWPFYFVTKLLVERHDTTKGKP